MKAIRWFCLLLSFVPILASSQKTDERQSKFSIGCFISTAYFDRDIQFMSGISDSLKQSLKDRYLPGSGWMLGIPISFSNQFNPHLAIDGGILVAYFKDETKQMTDSWYDGHYHLIINHQHFKYESYSLCVPWVLHYKVPLKSKFNFGVAAGIACSINIANVNTYFSDYPFAFSTVDKTLHISIDQWSLLFKLVLDYNITDKFFITLEPYYFLPLEGQKEDGYSGYLKYRIKIRGVGLSINYKIKKKNK
jgi:hypothetical protein